MGISRDNRFDGSVELLQRTAFTSVDNSATSTAIAPLAAVIGAAVDWVRGAVAVGTAVGSPAHVVVTRRRLYFALLVKLSILALDVLLCTALTRQPT